MSCRVQARRSAEQPERRVSAPVAPASPLEPDVERPRRTDADIDHSASGDPRGTSTASDPCGEALLDGNAR